MYQGNIGFIMAKGKKLTPRRLAREWALQFLYQLDIRQVEFEEEDLELFWDQLKLSPSIPKEKSFDAGYEYGNELIHGVISNTEEFNKMLEDLSSNWTLERMAVVDRNILRIGIYELLHTEVPAEALINEAVEISKAFGEKDSPSFINAILDQINKANK
jgi:transcription antitermination protein NusB